VSYPPGSIVKPIIYNSAVASGVIPWDYRVACTGHLYPDQPNMFRCWIYKSFNGMTHNMQLGGDLTASDAIMGSCNIYFYTVGRTLGAQRLYDWFGRFGVGRGPEVIPPRLGIGVQFNGQVGQVQGNDKTSQSEATLMGIGQGPIAWTPLHAADGYATLARGGVRILPRLRSDRPPEIIDLKLDKRAIAMALDGLHRSVSDPRGTGHHVTDPVTGKQEVIFNAPGVMVWGKSGTADAPAIVVRDGDKREFIRDGDHAWFVGLCGPAGAARPRYAISVVVEYGGSGGRVAGPIANQVIAALVAEGYLPDAAQGGDTVAPAAEASRQQ
jgi:penicillin-binding protein 2